MSCKASLCFALLLSCGTAIIGLVAVSASFSPFYVMGSVIEIPTYDEYGLANGTRIYDHLPADAGGLIEVPYQAVKDNEKRTAKINPNTLEYAECLEEGIDFTREVMDGLKLDNSNWTEEQLNIAEKASHGDDVAFCIEFYDQNK